jgi:hypothetical protein
VEEGWGGKGGVVKGGVGEGGVCVWGGWGGGGGLTLGEYGHGHHAEEHLQTQDNSCQHPSEGEDTNAARVR